MPQPQDKLAIKPDSNGHYSVAQLVQKARMLHSVKWCWEALGIDCLVRPRTHAENAQGVAEATVLQAVAGPDGQIDPEAYLRVELRTTLPCILYPDGTPMFSLDDVDAFMQMDSPTINEARDKVTEVSNWTKEKADDTGNDSGETDDGKSSSASPETAETSMSSPIPTL